jgi:prolyl oligopeptidase
VSVPDPYRWLEGGGEAVKKWSAEQSERTSAAVRAIPGFEQLRARVRELEMATTESSQLDGGGRRIFVERLTPPKLQPDLLVLSTPDDPSPRTLLDLTQRDPSGKTAIDFYEASADGRYVAVSLSRAGAEIGDVHVFDVQSGKELPDVVPSVHLPGPGGSVAWNADANGFFYSHHGCAGDPAPDAEMYCTTVYEHRLGKPVSDDKRVLGDGFPRITEIKFFPRDDGKYVVAR